MASTSHELVVDTHALVDIKVVTKLTSLSAATTWRNNEQGLMPRGLKIGRSVRWRLRTGDPKTGILDWIEAGCPRCDSPEKTEGSHHVE